MLDLIFAWSVDKQAVPEINTNKQNDLVARGRCLHLGAEGHIKLLPCAWVSHKVVFSFSCEDGRGIILDVVQVVESARCLRKGSPLVPQSHKG